MLKVAIAHEFLLTYGGAERTVKAMCEVFPQADVYTLLYDQNVVEANFAEQNVKGSWLQKLPRFVRNKYRYLFPLMRRAVEQWDFSDYDLVISSSSAYMHGVITNLDTKHLVYYHSPTRYLWDWHHNYLKDLDADHGLKGLLLRNLLGRQRDWDYLAAQRPEFIVANSEHIANRIRKFYRREPDAVIHPPVEIDRFQNLKTSDQGYFLYVGALTPYKNLTLAVELFNKIGRELRIVGSGKQEAELRAIAKDNVKILGRLNDQEVVEQIANCSAFIFPGEEDFGIAPVEAMAVGKPVFAYGHGGILETVTPGKTGFFFTEPNLANMETAFVEFMKNIDRYDPDQINKQAQKFSKDKFKQQLAKIVEQLVRDQEN